MIDESPPYEVTVRRTDREWCMAYLNLVSTRHSKLRRGWSQEGPLMFVCELENLRKSYSQERVALELECACVGRVVQ